MTKIIIDGDLSIEHIKKIGKLMVKEFKGKKEHVNMLILDNQPDSINEAEKFIKEMWK